MSQIDTYNGQQIIKNIVIDVASMENLEAKNITAETLKIDTDNTREQIKTNKIILSNNEINNIEIIEEENNDNEIITSKAYVDNQLSTKANTSDIPDISNCVKNNENQTLTNKFIMSNTSNEITAGKLNIIKSNDTSNTLTIEQITPYTGENNFKNNNNKLYTRGQIDYLLYDKITKNVPNLAYYTKTTDADVRYIRKDQADTDNNDLTLTTLKIKDYDNNNNYDSITKIKTGGNSDNDTLTTKGYVDNSISSIPAPDLSNCVKNNTDQTLTNKFIMSNTSNEININKLKMNDYWGGNTIDTIEKIQTGGSSDNDTLLTKGYIDNNYVNKNDSVGQKYIYNYKIGEIFNNYNTNTAPNEYAHAEGYNTHAEGKYSHAQNSYNTASGYASSAMGEWTTADQSCQLTIGTHNKIQNTGALFSVGNGTVGNRNDAFNVFDTGDVYIDKTININEKFNIYVGPITLKLEYNSTYNNYHSSFGVIYSWRDGNHKICILSNARVLLPKMTLTQQYIYVDNLYDGRTTNGTSGFTNKYKSLYNIDSNLGGGFVKVSNLYQLNDVVGLGTLRPYNINAYELSTIFYENNYPALFFDNCWFCIKDYYVS